jgi:FtsH-binding integral membrane protein
MAIPSAYVPAEVATRQAEFFRRVYTWMGLGLATTALVAMWVASSPTALRIIFGNKWVFYSLIIAELVLVFALAAALGRLRPAAIYSMFFLYSAMNGLTLAAVFLVYTETSIASTFFVTAGTFGIMSLYGYTTKRDLASWGSFLFMGLIGIILASLVNIFFQSPLVYWVTTYAGILVFVGLTVYDTKQLKEMAQEAMDEETARQGGIMGALVLYLDFINLFLMLLRILGKKR